MATGTNGSKAKAVDGIFAVEVEPGVFVYSLPPSHTLPAASRKRLQALKAEGAVRTQEARRQIEEIIAAQQNGHAAQAD